MLNFIYNSNKTINKIGIINGKKFAVSFLLAIFAVFFTTAVIPDNIWAGVKKSNQIVKSKSKISSISKKNRVKLENNIVKSNKIKSKKQTDKNIVKSNKSKRIRVASYNNSKPKSNKSLASAGRARSKISNRKDITENTIDKNSKIKIKQVSGIVKSSLHKTLVKMGLNKRLINHLSAIFKNTSALSNIQKGDLIQIAYQEKYVNNKLIKTGVITAAIVTSKKKSYQAYRFTYNGKHGYYDENGNSLDSSFLKSPLKYREITSRFSSRRLHPIKHIFQPHNGIDYAAKIGTPIKSVGDGVVIFKGYADSAGNYIKIKHLGIGISEYMHLSKFHKSIKVNQKVSKGDIIGYVGDTGYATGPHLHLSFIVNNRYVDYSKLRLPHGNPLPKKFRNLFFQHVAMINKQWNNKTAKRREFSYNTIYSSLINRDIKYAL